MPETNLRSLAPSFSRALGHNEVDWPVTMRTLKRLKTALPWWDDEDFLRVAVMARIEKGGPVPVYEITPPNARRLYELASRTEDGKLYDTNEPPVIARVVERLMKS